MTTEQARPRFQDVYVHVKTGNRYVVWMTAQMEADLNPVVVYQALTSPGDMSHGPVWVRPLSEFMDGRFKPNS